MAFYRQRMLPDGYHLTLSPFLSERDGSARRPCRRRPGTALREAGLKAPKPIAVRIVLDGLIVYQSFLPGTNESNNQWMNRKWNTVERCHTSSLRAAMERELSGVKENWQEDETNYAFCGGGFPIFTGDEFRGAAIVSGLPHLEDHRLLTQTVKEYWNVAVGNV